jgi:DNA polymerase-3 subunit delta'
LDDADTLQEEGANCLLKTLEEPPPGSVLILIGTSEQKTIAHDPVALSDRAVSRVAGQQVRSVLSRIVPQSSAEEVQDLAGCADGSIFKRCCLRIQS